MNPEETSVVKPRAFESDEQYEEWLCSEGAVADTDDSLDEDTGPIPFETDDAYAAWISE